MSTPPNPPASIGGIVHYVSHPSNGQTVPECRAAIVTKVIGGTDGRQVSLTIFNPEGSQIKANVSQLEPIAEGEPLVPGTWHWPELVTG